MIISISPGNSLANYKLLHLTNEYFNNEANNQRIIPVVEHDMVVTIEPYKVSFELYNEKEQKHIHIIKKYIELLFENKTIGIKAPNEYKIKLKDSKVNILDVETGEPICKLIH